MSCWFLYVKLLRSLLASVMGFMLGMGLAGVGGLSAETLLSATSKSESTKKIETYWSETGIGLADVEAFVTNEKCSSGSSADYNSNYFSACINAIAQAAAAVDMKLSETTGELVNRSRAGADDERSEAQMMEAYRQQNTKTDFDKSLRVLFSKVEPARSSMLAGELINSFLSVYLDAHTYIMPSKYSSQVSNKIERSKYFVGLSYERRNGALFILKIAKNSDAELSGLKAGDRLLKVNGEDVSALPYSSVSKIFKNEKTKRFNFEISRNGELQELTLERSYRMISHVQYNDLTTDKKIGLLTLSKFSKGACSELATVLKRSEAQALVLDLRDNPGGYLNEMACIAGLFLGKDKKAYYAEYLDTRLNEVVLTSENSIFNGPMTVLVNSRSASAAETLAGALKEYNRAVVVGRRTFGKGSFQEPEIWLQNPEITLFQTQGRYLLPSRNSTQGTGVKPNIELAKEADELREEDLYVNPLERANKKYPGLRAVELVKDFDYSPCVKSFKEKHIGDTYITAGIDVVECSLNRKNKLALSQPATLN